MSSTPRIRVLVVDDSVVSRKMVSEAVASSPALELVGTAPSGRIALDKLDAVNPDIVTLDVEMPDLDGIETLRALRARRPQLPVVMCSALTERGGAVTLEALALGAADYLTKPTTSAPGSVDAFRAAVVTKLRALGAPRGARSPAIANQPRQADPARPPGPRHAETSPRDSVAPRGGLRVAEAIAIGVSTGGPNALAALIPTLPSDLDVPLFIVQHMPPLFTRLLAERLAALARFSVVEAAHGAVIRRGCAYLAPGDFHMSVSPDRARIVLSTDPPENSCRPAVDVLFRSVAAAYRGSALAVVLTGMGQDGLSGCGHIRDAGGYIIAQDEATSVVWGMPGFVVNAGLADQVLPLSQIGGAVSVRLRRPSAVTSREPAGPVAPGASKDVS